MAGLEGGGGGGGGENIKEGRMNVNVYTWWCVRTHFLHSSRPPPV